MENKYIFLITFSLLIFSFFPIWGKDFNKNNSIKPQNNSLIELINPNGDEIYYSGSDTIIHWNSQLTGKKYYLELSTNKGESWEKIKDNLNTNQYKWKVPILNSNECLIKVSTENNNDNILDSFKVLGYGKLTGITFSPDDKFAVSRSNNGFIIVWDVANGEVIKRIYNELNSISLISLGSKNIVAFPSKNNQIKLLNIATNNIDSIFVNLPGVLTVLEWNPNGEDILIGDNRGNIRIINTLNKSVKYQIYKNSSSVQSVSWNIQGNKFVAGYGDGAIRLWNLNNGTAYDKLITYHSGLASSVSWSPAGDLIASGGVDHRIMIHDTNGNTIKSLAAHTGKITSLDWNNSGTQLLSGSDDNIVKKWTKNGELIYAYNYHQNQIIKVDWNINNTEFFTAALDNNIFQINALTNSIIKGFYGHFNAITQIAFHPFDNNLIAVSDMSKQILFWNINKNKVEFVLNNSNEKISCFDFNKFFEQIVVGFNDGSLKIYNANNGNLSTTINGTEKHYGRINEISFNPKANAFATAGSDGKIKIWNSTNGQLIKELEIHSDSVLSLHWHPSGDYLVSGGKDRIIKIIDVNTYNVINTLQLHTFPITDVEWNLDGDTLLTVDRNYKAYLWDTQNLVADKRIGELRDNKVNYGFKWDKLTNTITNPGFSGIEFWDTQYLIKKYNIPLDVEQEHYEATAVNWSNDGKILASGSDEGTIHLFYFNHIPELVQSDTSDNYFAIRSPVVTSFDVFMGYVNVGEDSTRNIYGFLANLTNAIVRVDSITFTGDTNEFDINFPETPFNLNKFEILTIPITFHPSLAGKLLTTFTIYTQNDTISNKVWGYGLRSDIKTRFIDFGIINVGDSKDSLATVLENLSDQELIIKKIYLIDLNSNFIIDTILNKIINVPANDSLQLPISFIPDSVGQFRAKLNFEFTDEINTMTTELFGIGSYIKPRLKIIKEPKFYAYCPSIIYDTLIIKNFGSETLKIDSIYIPDTTFFGIQKNIDDWTLDSNETQSLIVYFKAEIEGNFQTQLIINSNNYKDTNFIYPIFGNYEHIKLKIEPKELNIISACGNFKIDTNFVLKNETNFPINLILTSDSLISINSSSITLNAKDTRIIPINILIPNGYGNYESLIYIQNEICNTTDSLKVNITVFEPEFLSDTTFLSTSYSSTIDTNTLIVNPNPITFIIDSIKALNNADIIIPKSSNNIMNSNSTLPIEFTYKALHKTIDTTILRLYLSPCNQIKDIVIITQPIPYKIILKCDTIFAKINDKVFLPINITIQGDSNDILGTKPEINFTICFNKHLLNPLDAELGYVTGNDKCVDYSILLDSVVNRSVIDDKYLISLGDTDITEIKFININSNNSLVDIIVENGLLIITNICNEGGKRFVISKNSLDIYALYPNPIINIINAVFSIPRDGIYTIEIIDKLGLVYKTLFKGKLTNGLKKMSFDLSELQSGTYLIVIRNEDNLSSKVLTILK